ncbi:Crp/Fnr family transcriptional regulator [Bacillus norwichensis]|uniref:Crp/Fnr family transcriptional regulator n=1 Tax=Bacillus norwichensis TaxID=2762217 RepID=A0ABR8VPN9_9BACI|nr:Crp/Fnr family transcriptional regulator [Bacillus norwichensis]MBD8006734.1 Crp/Fnr family transcriptional regulator [Bacillus norwichensis]
MKLISDSDLMNVMLNEFQLGHIFDLDKQIPFALYQYKSGEVILYEGTEAQTLLFLVKGKVKVTSSIETGKSLLLRFSEPFSIVGDLEWIRNIPIQSQIEAVNDCLLIGLPFDYINKHEKDNSKFLHMILDHISYKLQTCTTASRVNLLASVENRFASYLLSTMSHGPENEFGKELKTSNILEIANLLGTTHRHLNRVIHSLTERKVIERRDNAIRILDMKTLEIISNGISY